MRAETDGDAFWVFLPESCAKWVFGGFCGIGCCLLQLVELKMWNSFLDCQKTRGISDAKRFFSRFGFLFGFLIEFLRYDLCKPCIAVSFRWVSNGSSRARCVLNFGCLSSSIVHGSRQCSHDCRTRWECRSVVARGFTLLFLQLFFYP